jgi:hypothetical protein
MRQYEPRYHTRRPAPRARRGADDPFLGRIGLMVFLFVLLVPVAMILRTDGKRHVSTNGLPGAAAVIEPGADTSETVAATATTTPATAVVTYPVIDPATGQPVVTPAVVGSNDAATKSAQSAGGSSNGSSSGSSRQQATATSKAKRNSATAERTATTAKKKRTTTTTRPKRVAPTTTRPKRATTTTKPKPKVTSPPKSYTQAQSEAIIRQIWPDSLEDKAVAIAKRESNLHAGVRNWCCYGLFQIHFNANKKTLVQIGITSPNQLFDPATNARAALVMYMRSGWAPWGG